MKICSEPNCNSPVFANLFCRYHQYKRHMAGGDLHKPKPRQKRIPKESKHRKEEKKTYKQIKDEIREELIKQGKYNCFFCDKPMGEEKGFHHCKGRDGTLYTDREFLKPAHNDCHVWHYHQAKIEDLIKETWYPAFLGRLQELDERLYTNELKKQEKGLLFEDD